MKVLTLLNEKGGVGKTTASITLACALAVRGQRVMLIDADPQANATQSFSLTPYPGFYNHLYRNDPIESCIKRVDPARISPDPVSGELWCMGGNVETSNLANYLTDFNELLYRMIALDDSNAIDTVIIDTQPAPNLMTNVIYKASDAVLYPVRLEVWGMTGLQRSYQYLERTNKSRHAEGLTPVEFIGVLPIATRLGTLEHAENFTLLKDAYGWVEDGGKVLHPIPQRTAWAESAGRCESIFLSGDMQAIAEANRLVNEVMYATTSN